VTRKENAGLVERFIDNHPDIAVNCEVPVYIRDYMTNEGCIQILPGSEDMDGFFIARLRRF
jgi:16S rRNA C967 or C1407 C5-methylase (RsmB/RsmF family)